MSNLTEQVAIISVYRCKELIPQNISKYICSNYYFQQGVRLSAKAHSSFYSLYNGIMGIFISHFLYVLLCAYLPSKTPIKHFEVWSYSINVKMLKQYKHFESYVMVKCLQNVQNNQSGEINSPVFVH